VTPPVATHYDNLKVGRDAPVGVIKTAYRKLSQKYHPDRNPDPAALEIMKMINLAWDVLSDPERRARHDRAIAALENRQVNRPATPPAPPAPPPAAQAERDWLRLAAAGVLLLLVSCFVWMLGQFAEPDIEDAPIAAMAPVSEQMVAAAPADERVAHGYLLSVYQDQTPGIAMVDIDNTLGSEDAEVRLFRNGRAARSMFVHKGKHFIVENLAPGSYVIKYKTIIDGTVNAYQERAQFTPRRDVFSKLKLRLFADGNGKQRANRIAPDQF
jgi:hypothetical protein